MSSRPAKPLVGVAIATHNRRQRAAETVRRLRALPEQPPIVVVDNASSDRTSRALEGTAGSDDDSWWEPGALARAAEVFERFPDVGLIAARILVGAENKLDPVCTAMARSPLGQPPGHPGPAILGFVACGAIVRRSAFLDVGGFDPILHLGGEETLLSRDLADAGWQLAFSDDVVAHHHPDPGVREGRRALEFRNRVSIAWLRRSRRRALALTGGTALEAIRDRDARAGLREVGRVGPELLHRRQRLAAHIDEQLDLVEARA